MKILITDSQLNKIINEQQTKPVIYAKDGFVNIDNQIYKLTVLGSQVDVVELKPSKKAPGAYDIKVMKGFIPINDTVDKDTVNHIMSNLGNSKINFLRKDGTPSNKVLEKVK